MKYGVVRTFDEECKLVKVFDSMCDAIKFANEKKSHFTVVKEPFGVE